MKALSYNRNYYFEFSNFYETHFEWNGVMWRNAEQAFQCAKAGVGTDSFSYHAENLRKMRGADAKKYGREEISMIDNWDEVKYDIMLEIVEEKFRQNSELFYQLSETGNQYIIHDTTPWHDCTWGRCDCPRCQSRMAENAQGNCLMLVRAALRKDAGCPVSIQIDDGRTFDIDLKDGNTINAVVAELGVSQWPEVVRRIV